MQKDTEWSGIVILLLLVMLGAFLFGVARDFVYKPAKAYYEEHYSVEHENHNLKLQIEAKEGMIKKLQDSLAVK